MKEVIEKLEKAFQDVIHNFPDEAANKIRAVIAELKTPRWYTPEQWKERTGEALPDKQAVYARQKEHGRWDNWIAVNYGYAKSGIDDDRVEVQIVVATEAGLPPDGWVPEENKEVMNERA